MSPSQERVPGKATASAPANIALIKYWGARDLDRALPVNPSLSMTLSRCRSRTTAEVLPGPGADEVLLAGDESGRALPTGSHSGDGAGSRPPLRPASEAFAARVHRHLGEIRRWAEIADGEVRFRIATVNTFPAAAGIASSASGFAALAVAAAAALGRDTSPEELSSLARRSGSGSAARSVLGGYVEWPAPDGDDDDPRAARVAPASHWDLRDLVAVVESGAKEVSSLAGHRRAATSPHFARRLEVLPERLAAVRRAVLERDFQSLAERVEEEAIDLHLIAMSSRPPIFYWQPATLAVLAAVRELRRDGVPACSTIDAGANVHVLCPAEAEEAVAARLAATPGVHEVLADRVGTGPEIHHEHLL